MVQDEAPAADIFGPMCHEMDGDVCSCLPLQLAELVPRLCAFVSNVQRLESSWALYAHFVRACTLEAWIISGVNRAEMTGWMASGVPTETQTVFTCSHRGYVSAHKLSSVVAKCTVPK